jgi:hypothetical protein
MIYLRAGELLIVDTNKSETSKPDSHPVQPPPHRKRFGMQSPCQSLLTGTFSLCRT